jgi:hypothetical protein
MKKSTLLFWIDGSLFGLLALTVLTVPLEVANHSLMHAVLGLLSLFMAGFHLWLHRGWIGTTVRRFGSLPAQVRTNAILNLALFCLYLLVAFTGLRSRQMLSISLLRHIGMSVVHTLLGMSLLVIQTIHLLRHTKWIKANLRLHLLDPLGL